ncbi:MAG: MerR family transcriptional regulator [Candidatus Neomarinimicrobiota bacterium]|nr:MAG: MerR family transcriptional regulator [Candidatus Neomarinimicrobiota bacterium]
MSEPKPGIKKLYYSIGEVSEITGIKPYVLRFWESEFRQLNPPKNRAGNRIYRQKDIDLILKIKSLLYEKKFTIKGAQEVLSHPQAAEMGPENRNQKVSALLASIRNELNSILDLLQN